MRPLIGVTPDTDDGRLIKTRSRDEGAVYLWDRYLRAFIDHGAIAVVLPVAAEPGQIQGILEHVDGIVLAGGHFDIHPRHYRERPGPKLGPIKEARTDFELKLLKAALKRDMPVLGICGGMQAINVVLGGTLFQDIPTERPGSIVHQQKTARTRPSHEAAVFRGTMLARIISGKKKADQKVIRVNSTHHQAVKDVGKGLIVSAMADDGLIEAIESPSHRFVLGTQWHPEMLYQSYPEQARIIEAFIKACKK